MPNGAQVTASAAEVIRNFGRWQERAVEGAVHITHHGRRRLVMMSAADYDAIQELRRDDRGATDPFFVADRVMAYSDDGFFIVDKHLNTQLINAAGCALLKTSSHEFVGKPMADLVPDLLEEVGFEMARRALRTGRSERFTVPSPRYLGRTLAFRAVPVHDCVAYVFRDVTAVEDEEQATGRLDATREAMALLSGVARARLSIRGTFADIDARLPAMLGLQAERLIGVRFVDVLAVEERGRAAEQLERVLLGGETSRVETALLANGGDRLLVEAAVAPVRAKEVVTGAIVVLTERGAGTAL